MKLKLITGTVIFLLLFSVFTTAGDTPWFDMENCSMCKIFSAEEGLMDNMSWEQYKTSDGFLSVSTVNKSHMEAYHNANSNANALGDKLMAGEELYMCGSCTEMGTFFQKGASMEDVKTKNGGIMIIKSSDAELVKTMHAWCDKNVDEMAKMSEMMEEKTETK